MKITITNQTITKNFWKYYEKVLEPKEELNHCLLKMIAKSILRIFCPKKIVENGSHIHHG